MRAWRPFVTVGTGVQHVRLYCWEVVVVAVGQLKGKNGGPLKKDILCLVRHKEGKGSIGKE